MRTHKGLNEFNMVIEMEMNESVADSQQLYFFDIHQIVWVCTKCSDLHVRPVRCYVSQCGGFG